MSPTRDRTWLLCSLILFMGCSAGKSDDTEDGEAGGNIGGSVVDARLIADVYTWNCYDPNTEESYQGAFGQVTTLENAPGGITALDLPAPGSCEANLDMFPDGAGPNGIDIAGLEIEPTWESDVDDGKLTKLGTGFYYDDVYPDVRTCYSTDEIMAGGVRLVDAGELSGIGTPDPAAAPAIEIEGVTDSDSIQFGDDASLSWGSHLWDEVWVQVRRVKEDEAWETVTCNATGLDTFDLDSSVWEMMDESLDVQQNNLYVGFQTLDRAIVGGDEVQVATRAIAVSVVQE
jgi:hypothetical protein